LYYYTSEQTNLIGNFNIHRTTLTKHLNNGTYYLGKYKFLREPVLTAKVKDMSDTDLALMLEKDRVKCNNNKTNNNKILSSQLVINKFILITPILYLFYLLEQDFFCEDSISLLSIIPVVIYTNADTQRIQILKENRSKSGIYRWVNLKNGKSYVGSSTNLNKRLRGYFDISFLEAEIKKSKSLIYIALLKYGYSTFQLEILELCAPEKCIEREQYYLDLLKPEYNTLKVAGSSLGFKHSEETVAILSAIKIGNQNPMYGNVRPEGAGKPHKKIAVLDKDNNNTTIYDSISAAAKALGIRQTAISNYFQQNRTTPDLFFLLFIIIKKKEVETVIFFRKFLRIRHISRHNLYAICCTCLQITLPLPRRGRGAGQIQRVIIKGNYLNY